MTCWEPSHWENGRRVTDWRWEARTVHGGWRAAWTRWVHTPEGWDEETACWGDVVFAEKPVAELAVAALNQGQALDG